MPAIEIAPLRITDVASRFERVVDVALSLIRPFRAHGGCGIITGDAAQQVQYAPDEVVDKVQWTWEKRTEHRPLCSDVDPQTAGGVRISARLVLAATLRLLTGSRLLV